MSLVKKLQPGGTVDRDALNSYINEEIASYKFKSKDERLVREKLAELRDYVDVEGNSFSMDPVAQKYTVTGFGSEKFVGSPDEIKSNWFTGNLRIKDPEDVNSVAAAIFGAAKSRIQKPVERTKEKLGIGKLGDFMVNSMYGSPEAFSNDFGSITDDEKRKELIYQGANKAIKAYLEGFDKNTYNDEFVDMDKLSTIQDAINIKDWEAFKTAAHSVHWDPSGLLLTESEKADLEAKTAEEKAQADAILAENEAKNKAASEAQKLENNRIAAQKLIDLGIPSETATQLVLSGFTLSNENSPFSGIPGQISNYVMKNVPFWAPKTSLVPTLEENIKDFLETNKIFTLQNQKGQYKLINQQGETYNESGENFDEFHPLHQVAWTHNNAGIFEPVNTTYEPRNYDIIFNLIPKEIEDLDYTLALKDLEENIKKESPEVGRTYDEKAGVLLYNLKNNTKLSKELILKIENILMKYQAFKESLGYTSENSEVSNEIHDIMKSGGILKAQNGLSFLEYKKQKEEEKKNIDAGKTATGEVKTAYDISDSWKDMSSEEQALRAASMAGIAGSFVPGYGAIGASVTLGADIAADIVKDGFQASDILNWNTAANLGFVALSFFGFGGVRALLKTGKAISKGTNFGKVASKAGVYGSSLSKAEKTAMDKVVELASKSKVNTIEELAIKVAEGAKGAKTISSEQKVLQEGLEVLGKIAQNPTPFTGVLKVDQTLSAIRSTVNKLPAGLESRAVRNTVRALAMSPGIAALPETAKTVYEKGWEYTKPEDIKNILMAGMVGKNWVSEFKGIRALKRQDISTGIEAKTVANINGKEIILSETTKPKYAFYKKSDVKEASFETFKKDVFKDALKEGTVTKEEIDAIKYKDFDKIFKTTPASKGAIQIGETPKNTGRGTITDRNDYERARQLIKEYGDPSMIKTANTVKSKINKVNRAGKKRTPKNKVEPSKVNFVMTDIPSSEFIRIAPENRQLLQTNPKAYLLQTNPKGFLMQTNPKGFLENPKALEFQKWLKEIKSHKKGGILKLQNSGSITRNEPKVGSASILGSSYKHSGNEQYPLHYTNIQETEDLSDYWKSGRYLKEGIYYDFANSVTQEQFDSFKNDLNAFIANNRYGDSFQVNDLATYKRLALDGKIGPVHNFTFNKIMSMRNLPTITPRNPNYTPSQKQVTSPQIAPPISQKPLPQATPVTPATSTKINTKPGFKNPLAGWDPANAIMAAHTAIANSRIGREQRAAIAAGLYSLPSKPHTYLRIDKPYSILAGKTAAGINSQAGRMARNTSDMNIGNAVQLAGMKQANDIQIKGQVQDQQRMDQVGKMQVELDTKVNDYNTNVLGKNRALAADAFSKIHLVNANEINANNTNFNKWVTAESQNAKTSKYKNALNDYWTAMNDPKIKAAQEAYLQASGPDAAAKARADYEKRIAGYKTTNTDYTGTYEGSDEEKALQNNIKAAMENLNLRMKPLQEQQNWLNLFQSTLYMKKGGLTKRDKLEIENAKANNKRSMKQVELIYKAMMHDDKMLQKSLIKIFK